MSLRDYLLTRMALRQDSRQRELDIEQARASRQAGEQAAYMQYGNAALQAAVQGAGKFAGAMSEADAAQKALEAEAIQARAASRALETTGVPAVGEEVGGVSPELPMPVGAYKAPQLSFLYDKDTATGAPPAVIAPPPAEQGAGGPFPSADPATLASIQAIANGAPVPRTPEQAAAAEAATLAALKAEESMTPGARAAADIFGTPAGTVEMPAGTKNAPTPSESTSVTRRGTDTARDTTPVPLPAYIYSAQKTSEEQKPRVESDVFNPTAKAMREQAKKDAAIEAATTGGTAAKRILSGPISVPEVPAMAAPIVPVAPVSRVDAGGGAPMPFVEPSAVDQGTSNILRRTLQRMQTKDVQDAAAPAALQAAIAAPAVVLPADTKMAAAPAEVQRAAQGPAGEALTPKVSDVMPIPGMGGGLSIPNPQAILARSTPEEDKVYTKAISDDLDKQIADLKLRTGLDLNKPAVAKSIEQASKVTGYTPPVYTKTARELAKEVTDQVWKTRPPGNPLTALFMRDNSALNKQIAEDKAFLIISGARTKHSAEHLDNFVKLEEMRTKQVMDKRKMDLMESQALLNSAKSDKLEVTIKKPLPRSDRQDLETGRGAVDKLEELKTSTSTLLQRKDKPGQLPIGPIRAFQKALALKAGINIGTTTSQEIDAKLGLMGAGAGGKVTRSVGGKIIDTKAFDAAFETLDSATMSDDEKRWFNDYRQAIQIVGKELEGGKLTDADLQNYKNILFASDNPNAFIDSLNQLGSRTSKRYANTRDMLALSYNLGDIYPEYTWSPIDYTGRITESRPSAAAMSISIPQQGANLAGDAMAIIQKAMQAGASTEDLAAAEAALKQMREQSAGGAGATEGNPADNPLGE